MVETYGWHNEEARSFEKRTTVESVDVITLPQLESELENIKASVAAARRAMEDADAAYSALAEKVAALREVAVDNESVCSDLDLLSDSIDTALEDLGS